MDWCPCCQVELNEFGGCDACGWPACDCEERDLLDDHYDDDFEACRADR